MRLRCVGRYINQTLAFEVGQVFDATPEQAAFLAADAPGCFEVADLPVQVDAAVAAPDATTSVDAAPADRMVRRGRPRKASDEDSDGQ